MSPRDRAIILTMFQGGMDVSTLCSMNYGHVRRGLETRETPLKLELFRKKSGTEYYTFLGRDAVESIRAYLNDSHMKGIKFSDNSPLFLMKEQKRLKTGIVQRILRRVALKAGFIDASEKTRDFNPLSPHALRESFSYIMTNQGVPKTVVDFWLGHEIGEMAETYEGPMEEQVRKMYEEKEKYISVLAPKSDYSELERKLEEQEVIISSMTKRLVEVEQLAENGQFYINKFVEEFRENPKKASAMYLALTIWMNNHWEELAGKQGLTDEEIQELAEGLGEKL